MLSMLRTALVAAALLIAGTLPATAQQAAPVPAPVEQPASFALTGEQIGAIAVGAVAGVVLLDVIGSGGMGHLTGAVLGGIVGYWIYTQPQPLPQPTPVAQGG